MAAALSVVVLEPDGKESAPAFVCDSPRASLPAVTPAPAPSSAPARDYADVFAGIARIGTGTVPGTGWSLPAN